MKYWIWAILPGLLATPARAANKCVEASGRIFYQAAPCPPNTYGGDLRWNVNRPFTGQSSRPVAEEALTITTEGDQRDPPTAPAPDTGSPRDAQP